MKKDEELEMIDIDIKNLSLEEKIDFVKKNIDEREFKDFSYCWQDNLSKDARGISAYSILDSESLASKLSYHLDRCTIGNAAEAFQLFLEDVKSYSKDWERLILHFDDRRFYNDYSADEYAVEISLKMLENEQDIQNRISLWEDKLDSAILLFQEKEREKEAKELKTLKRLQEKYCKKS